MRLGSAAVLTAVFSLFLSVLTLPAVDKKFHDAPASAKAQKNPLDGKQDAIDAGKTLYTRNCLACHGKAGQGTGNVPSLVDGKLKGVPQGEVFWFVTQGDKDNGMPSWASLAKAERWQVVTYVKALSAGNAGSAVSAAPAATTPARRCTASCPI